MCKKFNLNYDKLSFHNDMLVILDKCVSIDGIDQQLYGKLVNNYYDTKQLINLN